MTKSKTFRLESLLIGASLTFIMSAFAANAQNLRFWTMETQPDRLAKQQQMAADFEASTGIAVEVKFL